MELDISTCFKSLRSVFSEFHNSKNDKTKKQLERELDVSPINVFKMYVHFSTANEPSHIMMMVLVYWPTCHLTLGLACTLFRPPSVCLFVLLDLRPTYMYIRKIPVPRSRNMTKLLCYSYPLDSTLRTSIFGYICIDSTII